MKAIALAATVILSACSSAPTAPVVTIAPGLHPTLTAAQAERFARDAVAFPGIVQPGGFRPVSVVSITAIPGGMWVGPYDEGISWIVELRGQFVEQLGFHPSTARPASELRIMISDFDGSVTSFVFTG